MYANFFFGGLLMLQSGVNIMQSAAADLSFYDKSISAAKVILTGFTVVFVGLLRFGLSFRLSVIGL